MNELKKKVVNAAQRIIYSKKRGDEQIVIKLVLIGVAVILGFLFKDQLTGMVTTAMDSFSSKVNTLIV